jgi:hypothetical protein
LRRTINFTSSTPLASKYLRVSGLTLILEAINCSQRPHAGNSAGGRGHRMPVHEEGVQEGWLRSGMEVTIFRRDAVPKKEPAPAGAPLVFDA